MKIWKEAKAYVKRLRKAGVAFELRDTQQHILLYVQGKYIAHIGDNKSVVSPVAKNNDLYTIKKVVDRLEQHK